MNILLIISSLNFGGAEKQVIEDANLLCNGNKVFVLTFNNGPLIKLLNPTINVIHIVRTNYLRTSVKVASVIRKNNISVIHAHLYAPMVLSAIAGVITGIPVIWNFHSHAYENSFKGKMLHKYAAKLPSVKKILFPANELKEYYASEGYGFSRQKCKFAYNSGQIMESSLMKNSDAQTGITHIGFIGRVIPLKRIDILIELAIFLQSKGYRNFVIDIVGDGSDLSNLVQNTNDKQLKSLITFHGFQQDTLSYYRQFDIFAFPSGEEVLSLSLIDAGLAGLPSVAFNIGGNHEVVIDSVSGYLVETPNEFFNRIKELMDDTILRNKLGANAYKYCLSRFSPQARLSYLKNLYAEVI
jgi:glycosyltransferase involved in cell wall biosynthesis